MTHPAVPIADGADQDPSDKRATTSPEPTLTDARKPPLITVRIAKLCDVSYRYDVCPGSMDDVPLKRKCQNQ